MAIDNVMTMIKYASVDLAQLAYLWQDDTLLFGQKDLSHKCLANAIELLPELTDRLYYDKIFDKESIEDMNRMIDLLKEAFHQSLEENQWMDSQSKARALIKLEHMKRQIGFPQIDLNLTLLDDNHKNVS